MGKINSNSKGKVGEREVAELLRDYGFEARRGQQYSGGGDSPDVVSNLGLHIEVKRTEALNLYKATEQAKEDSGGTQYVVFHRKNKKDWVAIMDANEYLWIMRDYKELKELSKLHEQHYSELIGFYEKLKEENERLVNIEEKFNALTQ